MWKGMEEMKFKNRSPFDNENMKTRRIALGLKIKILKARKGILHMYKKRQATMR